MVTKICDDGTFLCGRRLEVLLKLLLKLLLEMLLKLLRHSVVMATTCVMMILNCPEKTVSSVRQRGAAGAQMVSFFCSLTHTHTHTVLLFSCSLQQSLCLSWMLSVKVRL